MRVIRMENMQGHGPFDGMKYAGYTKPTQKELYIKGFVSAVGWARIYEDFIFGYKALASADGEHPHHAQEGLHPDSPDDDHEWRVGVTDMDQFHHWFPEASIDFFRNHGFYKAYYEVDEEFVKIGRHQVLFCLDQAKLVKKEQLY